MKIIFDVDKRIEAKHINGYLMDGPDVWIESRNEPICDVPKMTAGNRPADGGHLIIEGEDYDDFVKREPDAVKFIKRLIGAQEFINGKRRYCLWLKDASPSQLRTMPLVLERIAKCRNDRMLAPDAGRQKLADTPHLFREILNPKSYVIIPAVSSENRSYVPIGFLGEDTIPTNLVNILPNATLYHFGVLTSSVHMAWMRTVCGRLKSDYRYSAAIVYNNFPWPNVIDDQKSEIEKTAQAILDARARYPDSSLADLYDPLTMPMELRKAHAANDAEVMKAYGFAPSLTEPEIVSRLFDLYAKMTKDGV